jgi:hypothetical protein
MSKKRQTRNTKKMQKALGSKRSRAGYRVGGAIKEDVRVSNPRQRPVLTNQEIGAVSNNRPKSSLISEFQQPIAKAPQESITKGVPFIPSETEIQPLTPVITKPTMPPSKVVKEMLSTIKDPEERQIYDQLFGKDLGSAYSFLQGGTESVRATETHHKVLAILGYKNKHKVLRGILILGYPAILILEALCPALHRLKKLKLQLVSTPVVQMLLNCHK